LRKYRTLLNNPKVGLIKAGFRKNINSLIILRSMGRIGTNEETLDRGHFYGTAVWNFSGFISEND
jgi:hypothetical protein